MGIEKSPGRKSAGKAQRDERAEKAQEKQLKKMTEEAIPPLVIKLAAPTVISMVMTSIYTMVDTFFVSRLGTSATGAVGVAFSLMAVIQAVGFTLGMGGGSLVSRYLGEKKQKEAEETASASFYGAAAIGLFVMILGLFLLDPLMRMLGATPTILPYAREYARNILFSAPFMCASLVLGNLLRSQGKTVLSMVGMGVGGLVHIGLDPVFIFGMRMGIAGASLAALVSQILSAALLLWWFLRGKSLVSVSPGRIPRRFPAYWDILKTGFPSFCRHGLAGIATAALNNSAAVYGDEAVAGVSLAGRLFMFVLSIMIGFGQGFQPAAGYNYGAGLCGRVKQAMRFCILAGTVLLTIFGIAGFIFAPQILALFRKDDPKVIAIGAFVLRAQCLTLPLQPLTTITAMAFQALGRSFRAAFLSSARQGVFFLPLIFLLPMWLGLLGVEIAQAAADFLTALICIPMLRQFFRELQKKEETKREATDSGGGKKIPGNPISGEK